MSELYHKHRAFADEYLRLGMNGTQAYKNIYNVDDDNKAAASASRLLRSVKVREYVSEQLQERVMTADEVLLRLAEQARAEHGRYINEGGALDIDRMVRDGKTYLIKSIRDTRYGRTYEFHDSQAALVHIGRHHALFTDKVQLSWRERLSPAHATIAEDFFRDAVQAAAERLKDDE